LLHGIFVTLTLQARKKLLGLPGALPLADIQNPSGVKYKGKFDGYWLVGMHGRASQLTDTTHRYGPNFQVPWKGTVADFVFLAAFA
jgi:hypothetical protein